MIRHCEQHDFETITNIINDGALAYRGIIPADRWSEPYMSREHLRREIDAGVDFWGYEISGSLVGVMGLQVVHDVNLIRHAYVRRSNQGQGIGARLLAHLRAQVTGPILIGTWADAIWAIRFYQKYGFHLVSFDKKEYLLRKYWSIPARQIETSVVLIAGELEG